MVNRFDVPTFIYFELASSAIVPVHEFTAMLNLPSSRWPLQTEGLPSIQPLGQNQAWTILASQAQVGTFETFMFWLFLL